MPNEQHAAELWASFRVLKHIGGRRIVRLGPLPKDSLTVGLIQEAGVQVSTIAPDEPLNSMYGAPSEPSWLLELRKVSDVPDALWIDIRAAASMQFKELLDAIPAAIERLSPRSLILVDDGGGKGGRNVEITVAAIEACQFRILFSGHQTLLSAPGVDPTEPGFPPLPLRRFDELTLDDGLRLQKQGNLWQAQRTYERILRVDKEHAGTLHALGLVHHQRGNQNLARQFISKAIARQPRNAVFHNNFGAAHQSAGKLIEALGCYSTAVALKPRYTDAISNLGHAWEILGELKVAETRYREALSIDPRHFDSLHRLGRLLERRGLRREAADLLTQATDLAPHSSKLFADLGNVLMIDSKPEQAAAAYKRSLELESNQPATRFNYAGALAQQDLIDKAREECRAACTLAPKFPTWRLREMLLCPTVFSTAAEIDEFRETLSQRLEQLAADPPKVRPKDLTNVDFYSPFHLSFQGREHRPLKEKFAALMRKWIQPLDVAPPKGQKPKVGFVVTRGHEGGFIRGTAGIAARLNRQLMDVVILCPECSEPILRPALQGADVEFVGFREDLDSAVDAIAKARCHVLYYWEVGTDSLNYALPFYRLAPVQVTAWGTQVTTGMTEVDYYLSSHLIETPDADRHYTEKLHRFESLPTFQERLKAPSPVRREHFGLPTDRPVYLCPQTILKLHPEQDDLFARVLAADPNGVLVVKEGQYKPAVQTLRERMQKSLRSLFDRVIFMPWQKRDDYFRLLTQADVVLDTHYFSAGSTTYDLFSFNEPVVTWPGIWNIGRYTLACYRKMGVAGLVASSAEEYARMATEFAHDRAWQKKLRQELRENSGQLFSDASAVAEHQRFLLEHSGI